MKKTLTIAGIIILALVITFVGVYFFAFSDPIVSASVVVTSGIVQVDSGFGFKSVTDMVKLSSGDVVRTMDGARAAIVIHESIVTLLEPNTQVEIKSLSKTTPKLVQEMGITFTRFSKTVNVRLYEIELPDSTISARNSAAYRINMDGVRVYYGEVSLKPETGNSLSAQGLNAIVLDVGLWNKRALSSTENAIMRENLIEVVPVLKIIRNNLVFKNKSLLNLAEKEFSITPVMFLDILNQADIGKISANEIIVRVPVSLPVMSRVVDLTQAISTETQNYYA